MKLLTIRSTPQRIWNALVSEVAFESSKSLRFQKHLSICNLDVKHKNNVNSVKC